VQWRRVDLVAKRLILSGHYACAVLCCGPSM
jgi:hypothetical protein